MVMVRIEVQVVDSGIVNIVFDRLRGWGWLQEKVCEERPRFKTRNKCYRHLSSALFRHLLDTQRFISINQLSWHFSQAFGIVAKENSSLTSSIGKRIDTSFIFYSLETGLNIVIAMKVKQTLEETNVASYRKHLNI